MFIKYMNEILVSIIIPSFNEENDIKRTLENIYTQLKNKENFELIIVDDSTDNTTKIIYEFKKKFSKLIVDKKEYRRGLAKACNDGVKLSNGDYICIINADNILEENFIENLEKILKKNKAIKVLSTLNTVANNNSFFGSYVDLQNKYRLRSDDHIFRLINSNFISFTEGFVVKKKIYLESGGIPVIKGNDFKAGEDFILADMIREIQPDGNFSSSLQIKHFIPEKLKDFYYNRFIRGYGTTQLNFYYYNLGIISLFTKTLVKNILKIFYVISIFLPLISLKQKLIFVSNRNSLFKLFLIYCIEQFAVIHGELKSLFKIIFLKLSNRISNPEYLIGQKEFRLYVSSSAMNKFSALKNSFKKISNNNIKEFYREKHYIIDTKRKKNVYHYFKTIFEKLGIFFDPNKVNKKIENFINKYPVELILFNKPSFISPSLMRKIKKKKIKTIIWSEDNMLVKQNKSFYFLKILNLTDIYYTFFRNRKINSEVKKLTTKTYLSLPFIELEKKKIEDENYIKKIKVLFIGKMDSKRLKYCRYLAENNICVNVYGSGWNNYVNTNKNLIIKNRPVFGAEYKKIISNSICLNFMRDFTQDFFNLKTIEIPAYGGFLLSEDTRYQKKILREKIEADYFQNEEDLLEKIIYWKKNLNKLNEVKSNGYKRILDLNLSTTNALNRLINKINL